MKLNDSKTDDWELLLVKLRQHCANSPQITLAYVNICWKDRAAVGNSCWRETCESHLIS